MCSFSRQFFARGRRKKTKLYFARRTLARRERDLHRKTSWRLVLPFETGSALLQYQSHRLQFTTPRTSESASVQVLVPFLRKEDAQSRSIQFPSRVSTFVSACLLATTKDGQSEQRAISSSWCHPILLHNLKSLAAFYTRLCHPYDVQSSHCKLV